jgi:hypothetical protein
VNRSRLAYAADGHVDPGGGTIQLMNRLASSGMPGGHEGPTDSGEPKRRLSIPPFVLQPPSFLRYPSGLTVSTKVSAGADGLAPYRLWQRGTRILNYQRILNLLMDGGPGLPKWRDQNGSPWTRLIENGVLDPDTQEALRYYQMFWGLEPSGDLCMVTRTLLNPYLQLRGQLQLHYPTPRFRGPGAVAGGLAPSPSTRPSRLGFQGARPIAAAQIKLNNGFGIKKTLWSGGILGPGDGMDLTPPLLRDRVTWWSPEPNHVMTFDVTLPVHAALGTGDVTLKCEMDDSDGLEQKDTAGPTPADEAPTAKCTIELKEPDNFSLWPSLGGSVQDERGRLNGAVRAGLKFKIEWKFLEVKAEGTAGVASHEQHVVIPIETTAEATIHF